MALSTSFTGGWFYLGQFFDHAVGGFLATDEIAKHCRERTEQDVVRSRGRFQVFTKAEDVIGQLAETLIDEDDDWEMMKALRAALDAHHIDWKPEYFDQLLAAREALPEWQARLDAEEKARASDWLNRRKAALRRVH